MSAIIGQVTSMNEELEEEPALVVAFGSTATKRRPLVKPATLIGRNRGCDIRVESPEVSGLHCLISRHAGTLTLRDCDSKSGVLLNGKLVREAPLQDGDQLQVGPFAFIVQIPATFVQEEAPAETIVSAVMTQEADSALAGELENAQELIKNLHRHIAGVEGERDQLALQLKSLRAEHEAAVGASDEAAPKIAELESLLDERTNKISEFESRLFALEEERSQLSASLEEARLKIAESAEAAESGPSPEAVAELEATITQLRTDLESAAQDRAQLEAELAETRRIQEKAQELLSETLDRATWLETEIEHITAERNRLRADAEASQFANDKLAADAQLLEEELTRTREQIAEINAEREALTETVAELREQSNQQASASAEADQHQTDELEEELAATRKQLESLQQGLESIQSERDSLAGERDSLLAMQEALESEKETLQSELEQLRSASTEGGVEVSAETHPEVERLTGEIEQIQRHLDAISGERDQIRQELDQMRAGEGQAESQDVDALEAEMSRVVEQLQRAESGRQDLERRLEAEHNQHEERLAILRQQLDDERTQMKQLVMQAAADHDRTRSEMESLRSALSGQQPADIMAEGGDEIRELLALRQRVAELEAGGSGGEVSLPPDLAEYEQQLHQYRDELEQAQSELTRREEEIEAERSGLHEKLKHVELDLSKERASLAREKAELERMRREFVTEVEHLERESQIRAKLAPVEQLAHEVKGRVNDAPAPQTNSLGDRLRGLIRRATDGGGKPPS